MDTVLYSRIGRADFHPVMSVDPASPVADDLIAAKKQELLAAALRSGAQVPEFKLVAGKATTKKEG